MPHPTPAGFIVDEKGYLRPDIPNPDQAPAFLQDADGNLVPTSNIDDVTLQKDELVKGMYAVAAQIHTAVKEFKETCRDESIAHLQIANGDRVTENQCKESTTLYNFDGSIKWKIEASPDIRATERVIELQALIRKAMNDLTGGLKEGVGKLLETVLNLETGKTVDLKLLEKLRKNRVLQGKSWEAAMAILPDCTEKVGVTVYHRFYRKDEETGQWLMLPLNFSAIEV